MNGIPKYSLFVKVARGVFQFGVVELPFEFTIKNETIITGQIIATSHNRFPPIFSGNLACRNIIPFGQIIPLAK